MASTSRVPVESKQEISPEELLKEFKAKRKDQQSLENFFSTYKPQRNRIKFTIGATTHTEQKFSNNQEEEQTNDSEDEESENENDNGDETEKVDEEKEVPVSSPPASRRSLWGALFGETKKRNTAADDRRSQEDALFEAQV